MHWIVAITGASGVCYGLKLVKELARNGVALELVVSEAAHRVLADEAQVKVSSSRLSLEGLVGELDFEPSAAVTFHNPRDIGATIASGSFKTDGMVIIPCSMSTLGAIANGVPSNLIHRAAEVVLKEQRKLILVPRETPLTVIHLENMTKVARCGAVVAPAMPGFYHNPNSIDSIVDMMVMKVLDLMGIENGLVKRWGQDLKS